MKTFKLENEPKIATGFKTPDHYFENFSLKMMQQLPESEPKVISIFQKRKNLIMMVAAVLVIALMIPILNYSTTSTSELDSTALENYITYQSNVNQYDLMSGLESEDINSLNTSITIADETIEDVLSENSNLENLILE
ncbi:hypothetical protein [Flavobacterium caseinilyticum]|uniref:Uncharacterized protein n=1 Tax=Flavobacterium caseinilyticum TaxID=2541732 RepID=A0A4R5AWF0_9FLAO|nr:hypothetical protein [Flavobacterium caseinilyticum]TDD77401.1 hypothetical protein E0F89_07375 [Flavobacterium caseinilyticum]